jgi:hypothetical protein
MANLLLKTEDFSDEAVWSFAGVTVTSNTAAAPAIYGVNAGLADTVTDVTASLDAILQQVEKVGGTSDTDPYIVSVHVKKDAITNRFCQFYLVFAGVSTAFCAARINTSTGEIVSYTGGGASAPTAQGVVDHSDYWRFWVKWADPNANSLVRWQFWPAVCGDSISGDLDGAINGSVILQGANVTQSDTLLDYEPAPFYEFVLPEVVPVLVFNRMIG